jgi:hypothetical protein
MAAIDEQTYPHEMIGESALKAEERGRLTEPTTSEPKAAAESDTISATPEEHLHTAKSEVKNSVPVSAVLPVESKKTKAEFEEVHDEPAPPPPYSGPAVEETAGGKKRFRRTRRILFLLAGFLLLFIILLSVLLGVLLIRNMAAVGQIMGEL